MITASTPGSIPAFCPSCGEDCYALVTSRGPRCTFGHRTIIEVSHDGYSPISNVRIIADRIGHTQEVL